MVSRLNSDEVRALIALPESETLEFELRLPNVTETAKLIASFANTKGGTLLVGVEEGGKIVGLAEPEESRRRLKKAATTISPAVDVQTGIVSLDDKSILVAIIQQGSLAPYLVRGQAFQRMGARTAAITSHTLYDSIRGELADPTQDMLIEVQRFSRVIEQMNRELIAAGGWRSKVQDWIIGGIVGALISAICAAMLGALSG